MTRQRIRIQFRKGDDLRFISHRDLVRVFERMFRRIGLKLRMSEGFHPKVKMSFPSALGLGMEGAAEIMEFELEDWTALDRLIELFAKHAPAGLNIFSAVEIDPQQPKPRVESFTYRIPVPSEKLNQVKNAIERFQNQLTCLIEREDRKEPIDVRVGLQSLDLVDDELVICLRHTPTASVRPREVLDLLELTDLEREGYYLTRTAVNLAS